MSDHADNFPWGKVIRQHEIGPYRILEYHPRKVSGSEILRTIDYSEFRYHLFICDEGGIFNDANECYKSLDAALAAGIAYRAEGGNHRADYYFIAALDETARRLPRRRAS